MVDFVFLYIMYGVPVFIVLSNIESFPWSFKILASVLWPLTTLVVIAHLIKEHF